jgi:hypothetical protein
MCERNVGVHSAGWEYGGTKIFRRGCLLQNRSQVFNLASTLAGLSGILAQLLNMTILYTVPTYLHTEGGEPKGDHLLARVVT